MHSDTIGSLRRITLLSSETKELVSVLPDYGATVHELVLQKNGKAYELLEAAQTEKEIRKVRWFRSAKLIPFPNRVNDGVYTFEGKIYRLPINFPLQHHANHGLIYDKPFSVVEQKTGETFASLALEYKSQGELQGYPFSFRVLIRYTLRQGKGFECFTCITNTDKSNIPVGDGWHPYFMLGGKVDDFSLAIPPARKIEVNERLIPTGKKQEFSEYRSLTPIGKRFFDDGFILKKNKSGIAKTRLRDPRRDLTLTVWQETGRGKYNYLQIFTPPSRTSIAVEPMSCATNAFNSRDGLTILKPGAFFNARYGVTLR